MNGYCENDYISNQQKEDFFYVLNIVNVILKNFLQKKSLIV